MKNIEISNLPFSLIKIKDVYGDLMIPENKIRYQLGLFNHLLNADEVSKYYDSNDDAVTFTINENKFLNFFTDIFFNAKLPIIIEFNIERLKNNTIIEILESLDYLEKEIWIEFVRNINNSTSNFYEIENETEIKMFLKLITRETYFPTIHLENGKINIIGNYDMFLPLLIDNEFDIKKLAYVANKYELHILEI